MESEKVKEIKKALEDNKTDHLPYIDGNKCKFIDYADILSLINELESEHEWLSAKYRNLEINYNDAWEQYREYEVENKQLKERLAELEDKIERGELTENTFVTYYNMARSGGKALTEKALKFDELKAKIDNGTLIELPKKCYQVIWVLGWEIIEYDIVSITYDYDKATITKVIAVRPHSQQVFTDRDLGHFDGIDTDVFFSKAKAEAEKELRESQKDD